MKRGLFNNTQCLRVFHGPGESRGPLSNWAIDQYGDHYWVTEWDGGVKGASAAANDETLAGIAKFLRGQGAGAAVVLRRPGQGIPSEPALLLGDKFPDRYVATEGPAKFWIQMEGVRHPGLFLDHLPLRRWLMKSSAKKRVLNTFAYTGSLSVAAGLGGAEHVTTLDLSKATTRWAQENWELNSLPSGDRARFIGGDVFEWLPRLKKGGEKFDYVILDPPSFSRGHKGSFSTAKDLPRLHKLAMDLIPVGGVLITSINSANVSWDAFEDDVLKAAEEARQQYEELFQIEQPETFPVSPSNPATRYLKGWGLRRVR